MKNLITLFLILTAFSLQAQSILKAEDLQKDFAIVRKSYETMHPGLYKYANKATIDAAFEVCKSSLDKDQTLAEAYLNFHKLTSKFKCGHAYPNFYNQEAFLKKELFENKNALPFHFRLIDGRMLVVKSADAAIKNGIEIKSINGQVVSKIIKALLPIVRADGSNDGKRRKLLEISGQYFEYFDVFFPMYFPIKNDFFDLVTYDFKTQKTAKIRANTINHVKRDSTIKIKYREIESAKTLFSWLNDETAIMQINSFANYDGKYNFGKFFADALTEYQQKNGKNLIIDIRNNEGGNTSEVMKLVKYLIQKPIQYVDIQNSWAFEQIDSTLKPFVDNKWAMIWFNQKYKQFEKLPNGQYKDKNLAKPETIEPEKSQFKGKVYLLTSPTNSSATYVMADIFKTHQLATLVGQTTGGNQKGITASAMFFMLLPNTKIEVDVPLIGTDYEVAKTRPDAGIEPDVFVKPNIENAVKGIDTEMEAVKQLITKQSN